MGLYSSTGFSKNKSGPNEKTGPMRDPFSLQVFNYFLFLTVKCVQGAVSQITDKIFYLI
jgi:hypothetical protein